MITGLSYGFHDAAATRLSFNGEIIHAIHSERYSKKKFDRNLHKYNPVGTTVFFERPFRKNLRRLYAGQSWKTQPKHDYYIDHHWSHAAAAYYTRPWNEEPVCVVVDAIGEWDTASIWFKNVSTYIQAYSDVQVFLPVVVDTDEKGGFVGFTNEATFAASFNTEIGILTNDLLNQYQNFQTSGMVVKKSTLDNFGGFKKSMKLTFVYEFLLRLSYNSVEIMTIPRIGYKHMNMREGSIFWNYKFGEKKISEDEVAFWIDSAKKEHFFIEDRDINYQAIDV